LPQLFCLEKDQALLSNNSEIARGFRVAKLWSFFRRAGCLLDGNILKIALLLFFGFYLYMLSLDAVPLATGMGASVLDRDGYPIGGDFSHYWLAANIAHREAPALVYNFTHLEAAEKQAFGAKVSIPWLYPPTFLLLLLPLGFLPYLLALAVWLGTTLTGYLLILRRIAPHRLTIWLALAYFGTFTNFNCGQNGFLSAGLLGGGLLLLDHYPLSGGLLLGMLSFKPHLAALVPVALIAGRRWRALVAMLAGAAALAAVSVLVLGAGVWTAFFNNASAPLQLLHCGRLHLEKMRTIFAAATLFGANLQVALALQGAMMALVIVLVALVWRRGRAPLSLRATVLVAAMLLATPYAHHYDLALLALPLAWLGWEGHRRGWCAGEQFSLLLVWLLPLILAMLEGTGIQIGPVAPLILIGLALRRLSFDNGPASALKLPLSFQKTG
jgi:hypothetical protein